MQKGFLPIWMLVVFLVLAIAASAAVYNHRPTPTLPAFSGVAGKGNAPTSFPSITPTSGDAQSLQTQSPLPSNAASTTVSILQNGIAGWTTYRNDKYGFTLQYSPTWALQGENDLGIGTGHVGKYPSFFGAFFGPSHGDMHIVINLLCPGTLPHKNFIMSGKGHDLKVVIDNTSILLKGEDPVPSDLEGEPEEFQASLCGKNADTTCLVVHGYDWPIAEIDTQLMKSIHFFKSLDSLTDNCPTG